MNNPKYYIGSFRFGYWTVGTGKCPCNTNKIVFGSVVDIKVIRLLFQPIDKYTTVMLRNLHTPMNCATTSNRVTFGQSAVYSCTVQTVVFDSIEKLHRCFVFGLLFVVVTKNHRSMFFVRKAKWVMIQFPM